MPRVGQIIPSYLVPHVQTYINDNSKISDDILPPSEDGVRLLCVFTSAKGEDGVIHSLNSLEDYIEEYGTPNFAMYGQPCYMPYAALKSGNAKCHCLRVMPTDAAYANVVICAYTKTVYDPVAGTNTFTIKFDSHTIEGLVDRDSLALQLENFAVLPPEVNDDGYNVYPLFIIAAKGRGMYGNSYRIRIVGDEILNIENEFQNYILEVLDISSGALTLKEQHRGSFDYNAIVDNNSLLFDDIICDPEFGSNYVSIATNYDNFVRIYDAYVNAIGVSPEIEIPEFANCNLLNGLTKDETPIPGFAIAEDSVINLDTTIGISLNNGTDGSISVNAPDRLEAIDQLYIDAFSRNVDTFIGSKRAIPCDLILDANYSEAVKMKMVELALHRYDARVVVDAGILPTPHHIINWLGRDTIKSLDDFIISKECTHKKIRDPFTNRIITVTYTYELAEKLPTHYKTIGNHIPFVGEAYSTCTDFVDNSIKPVIDADDLEFKERLYKQRCNFVECIAENTYVRATQGTSQFVWTDLSEENNVAVLLEMKRMLEEFVSARLYNFAEVEDRQRFTEAADRMFTDFRQTKVRSYEVYFDMNKYEEERNILHCYLAVTFKTLAKRGIIEIDINKRV